MIAIVDCNNLYCSCERVFNPTFENRPVVVLSNNDGIIIARSNEAKDLGIRMGEPVFKVRELLIKNNVAVFSSNYTLYGDMSRRVMNILSEMSPNIEIYSVDEAFLDFSGFEKYNITDYSLEIKQKIRQWTGIPVSVGVAETKTLAKIASRIAKKNPSFNGVFVIDKESVRIDSLHKTSIEDVWGIGRRLSAMLHACGIHTALDFANTDPKWVKQRMTITGLRTWNELNGESCIELETVESRKKSIVTSRTFGEYITEKAILSEALANFAVKCAYKLRKQKSCARELVIFIKTNHLKAGIEQYYGTQIMELPVATNSSIEIIKYVNMLLERIYKPGLLYNKAGVIVQNIVSEDCVQGNLFDTIDRPKHNKLMKVIDNYNDYIGREKIRIMAQGFSRKWHLKNEHISKCFSTNIKDSIIVNCIDEENKE